MNFRYPYGHVLYRNLHLSYPLITHGKGAYLYDDRGKKYLDADVGLTGANFISAESGRIAICTNEGNARFSVAANRIHIVVAGIEKLITFCGVIN